MNDYILILTMLFPVIAGILLLVLPTFQCKKQRDLYVAVMLIVTAVITVAITMSGEKGLELFYITKETAFAFKTDALARFFLGFINLVWPLVGIFSLEYMKHEEREEQFAACYLIVYGILNGLSMSANLVTFYLFYELMTLLSVPLVLHTHERKAIHAAKKYLFYSIAGASMALFGIFFLNTYTSSLTFNAGGTLHMVTQNGNETMLLPAVGFLLLGFGTKAGLFPMHAWLPTAHPVAPAPASAVLSGVITKAGVLGILRVVFYITGPNILRGTWVQHTFLVLTLVTVFMGSMLAYKEQEMKKRFAYSTVSQLSYILFGIALLTENGLTGSLLHIIFHSLIKNALFVVAGIIIYKTGKKKVKELVGIGKQMPFVIGCFLFAALALVGIPPTSGFISKWFLAIGALDAKLPVFSILGPVVLLLSALLTAGYLLPIALHGFLPGKEENREVGLQNDGQKKPSETVQEVLKSNTSKWREPICMYVPLGILVVGAVLLGMFPTWLLEQIQTIITGLF